ncbi:TPA: YggT family protein [Candidatus Poribacteria bacterium]|nr:YggT family protein [Candidatus Poribacteria bacterium]
MSLIIRFIDFAINIYTFLIIVRAIISWVSPDPYNPIVRALDRLTEPILYPIRKMMWRFTGNLPIDFSPLIAIILIQIAGAFIKRILFMFLT